MAHYTYGPFPLPYSDAIATIYNANTAALATLYDDSEAVVANPTYSGDKLYFRVDEGAYLVSITRPAGNTTATTRVVVPDSSPPLFSVPSSGSSSGGAGSPNTVGAAVDTGSGYPPRPIGFDTVIWVGPGDPATAAHDNDVWVPTA